MKKKLSKKYKIVVIIIVVALLAVTVVAGVYIYKKRQSNKGIAVNPTQTSTQTNTSNSQSSQQSGQDTNTSAPAQSSSTPAPIPKQPILIKSSGNNGPVPSGVNISFTCTAELGVDCSIILDSNGKQTVLGPTKVADNGRGQYFASFYWISVKGGYKVSAQAKNSQGGASSSIMQALEVQ